MIICFELFKITFVQIILDYFRLFVDYLFGLFEDIEIQMISDCLIPDYFHLHRAGRDHFKIHELDSEMLNLVSECA